MRASRFLASLSIAALALLGSACVSAQRAWRISPFSGGTSENRVSLWPIAHHDSHGTSVLWPLADVDGRGFAVRPLAAKDGTRWEVLWPWASFDTRTNEGWAVPFYSGQKNAGLFPIANLGPTSWVGPFWWHGANGGKTTSGGIFPIVTFSSFSYVGPIWWTSPEGNFGVFPLFGVAPLRHVGPVWWKRSEDGTTSAGLFPLVHWADEGREFALVPFYWHDLEPNSTSRTFLAGLGHTSDAGDAHTRWWLPFYFEREREAGSDTVLLPFFWKHVRGGDAQVFTLLGNRGVDAESTSLNVYPLWWSNESKDSSWRMLLPIFYYEEDGAERRLVTPLGGRGWSSEGASRFVNVLGPIYHSSRSADGREERTSILWPFFERHRDGDETTTRAAPFFSVTEEGDETEAWYALGLGHVRDSASGGSHRLWPFYAVSNAMRRPGPLYGLTLYGSWTVGDRTTRHLFPLFESESARDRLDVSIALGLGAYVSHGENLSWRVWPFVSRVEGRVAGPAHWTTLFGSAEREDYSEWHAGTSLVYSHTERENARSSSDEQRWLTLFTYETEESRGLVVPSSTEITSENRIARSERGFFFGLFSNESEEFRVWRDGAVTQAEASVLSSYSSRYDDLLGFERKSDEARRILTEHGFAPAGASDADLRESLERFVAANTRTAEHRELFLPLIAGYERRDDEVSWNGPLWLAYGEERADYSLFSFLFYAYRSETEGSRTRRDIFPFITWDSAPDATTVSFLWRLFRYERCGERSGGHVLFVPWGDTGD